MDVCSENFVGGTFILFFCCIYTHFKRYYNTWAHICTTYLYLLAMALNTWLNERLFCPENFTSLKTLLKKFTVRAMFWWTCHCFFHQGDCQTNVCDVTWTCPIRQSKTSEKLGDMHFLGWNFSSKIFNSELSPLQIVKISDITYSKKPIGSH